MENIAYIRVSSVDQNLDRQIEALKKYKIDKFFSEKVSGKNTNRPQLKLMFEYIREGDTIYIEDFSRLARSTSDLLSIIDILQDKNVMLVSLKENIDTNTPQGKLMLTMIAAINEFERANILERQREGIAIAKAKGVYKGRRPIQADTPQFREAYNAYMARKINKTKMAENLHISRPTLNRLIREFESKEQL